MRGTALTQRDEFGFYRRGYTSLNRITEPSATSFRTSIAGFATKPLTSGARSNGSVLSRRHFTSHAMKKRGSLLKKELGGFLRRLHHQRGFDSPLFQAEDSRSLTSKRLIETLARADE